MAIRGQIWVANLDPTRGSEQTGVRPVIIFQADVLTRFTNTVKPGSQPCSQRPIYLAAMTNIVDRDLFGPGINLIHDPIVAHSNAMEPFGA